MTMFLNEQRSTVDDEWGTPLLSVRLVESFDDVVALNPQLRIEQKSSGEVVFMSPTGGESSDRNSEICYQLRHWTKKKGGHSFDSSVLFCLPNGAKRSPDASWISDERWNAISKEDRKRYPPLCPDFVIELRSETDRLVELREKMQEYVDNGIRLGWLIDPLRFEVHVYRPNSPLETLLKPESLSGEAVLPEFVLDLRTIWPVD